MRPPTIGLKPVRRVAGVLLSAALLLSAAVPDALAANPPPPPIIDRIDQLDDGGINILFHTPQILVPSPNSGGGSRIVPPDGQWGFRFNVYIEQTGELINTATSMPFAPENYYTGQSNHRPDPDAFFAHRGSTSQNRYCIIMQAYVGDGTDAGSTFSPEGNRKCIGTQSVLIVTQGQPLPPTKPDLAVTRVTGPDQIFDGTTAVYEIFLWNDGTPAQGTAQILLGIDGNITPVDLVETPDGFTCTLGQYGYSCLGSLGGVDDALQTRGALFRVQVRGNGPGSATVYGSANHDRTLDEMTVDNNLQLLSITVK